MEKLYTVNENKTRSCGSDHELLIAKFRLKLKKVGKPTRPFRYDLNQISYDYTEEVRNRFNGLDQIDRVPDNYGQRFVTLYRRQGSRPSPWKRNAKKQNGFLGRPYKRFTEHGPIYRPNLPQSQSLTSGSFLKPLIHQKADRMKITITEH